MKKIILYLLLVLVVIKTITLQAQSNEKAPTNSSLVPSSPNAASLGVFGDIPVGHYTGIPNITIPLYEINSGNISVPINLQYHASGIKVSQEASWVGLGWALNAGGVITRSVRGLDDFSTNPTGFLFASALPMGDIQNDMIYPIGTDLEKVTSYYEGHVDSEPDIFYFNFGNYAGKMIFSKEQDAGDFLRPTLINQVPIDIKYYQHEYRWTATTPDGCIYYFGTREWSYDLSIQEEFRIPELADDFLAPNRINSNSWYLDSIVSPEGNKVRFSYATSSTLIRSNATSHFIGRCMEPKSNALVSKVFYIVDIEAYLMGEKAKEALDIYHANIYTTSAHYVYETLLKEISFDGGKISFIGKDRYDLLLKNGSGSTSCLDKIEIKNNTNQLINSFQFVTDYFKTTASNEEKRLRLDAVIDMSGAKHSFDYIDGSFTSRSSFAIDHWGLYNGVTRNTQLIPSLASYKGFYPGANREPSFKHACQWTLNRIDYPTGGYSKFEYEMNDYGNREEEKKEEVSIWFYGNGEEDIDGNPGLNTPGIVEISKPTQCRFDVTVMFADNINCWDGDQYVSSPDFNLMEDYLKIEEIDHNGNSIGEIGNMPYQIPCDDIKDYEHKSTDNRLYLESGRYRITTFPKKGMKIYGHLSFLKISPPNPFEKGGGLRIKSIEKFDGNDISKISYEYIKKRGDGTVSSGKLMSYPVYSHYVSIKQAVKHHYNVIPGTYFACHSESIYPLGTSAQGNFVGYSQVAETKESTLGYGKTIYYFNNYEETIQGYMSGVPGIPNLSRTDNGLLDKKEILDEKGRLVQVEKKLYNRFAFGIEEIKSKNSKLIKGAKVWVYPGTERCFTLKYYDVLSQWDYLKEDSIITYKYDVSPTQRIATSTEYFYENLDHKQLTAQITKNSDGTTVKKSFKYPHDYSKSPYTEMVKEYIINPVVSAETSISTGSLSKIIKVEEQQFKCYHSRFFKPELTKNLETLVPIIVGTNYSSNMKETANYDYNKNGKLIKLQLRDGVNTIYLWSYYGQYPIAEIKGSTYEEVSRAVSNVFHISIEELSKQSAPNADAIKRLALDPNLSNALVTTYTYKPLVGMTSATDPSGITTYYDYDSFGRLQETYLMENGVKKILQKYDYHYRNQ